MKYLETINYLYHKAINRAFGLQSQIKFSKITPSSQLELLLFLEQDLKQVYKINYTNG